PEASRTVNRNHLHAFRGRQAHVHGLVLAEWRRCARARNTCRQTRECSEPERPRDRAAAGETPRASRSTAVLNARQLIRLSPYTSAVLSGARSVVHSTCRAA